jgi:hypothetical protein
MVVSNVSRNVHARSSAHSTISPICASDLPTDVPPYFWTTHGMSSSQEFASSCCRPGDGGVGVDERDPWFSIVFAE